MSKPIWSAAGRFSQKTDAVRPGTENEPVPLLKAAERSAPSSEICWKGWSLSALPVKAALA